MKFVYHFEIPDFALNKFSDTYEIIYYLYLIVERNIISTSKSPTRRRI